MRVATGTLALALLGPVTGSAASPGDDARQTRDMWLRTVDELETAEESLENVDAAVSAAVTELDRTTARLTSARRRLVELGADLRAARAAARRAERRANDAASLLGQATMVVAAAESALQGHIADLRTELASAYKYAGTTARISGIVEALHASGTLTEFLTAYEQLELGAEREHGLVVQIGELAARLEAERADVAVLRSRREATQRRAVEERDAVRLLTVEQRELVEQIARERARRTRLVGKVRGVQATERRRVAELSAASTSLRRELAAYRYVGGAPGTGDLAWPTDGGLSSGFGYRMHPIFDTRRLHTGVDVGAPTGQEVFAAAAGTVLSAGARGGYGTTVVVDHGGGLTTVYAHLSFLSVRVGQRVEQVDVVGHVGSTGSSTGPHLHFEVREQGIPRDPLDWF